MMMSNKRISLIFLCLFILLSIFVKIDAAWIVTFDHQFQSYVTTVTHDSLYILMTWWTDLGSVTFFIIGTIVFALTIWFHPDISENWIVPLIINMLGIAALSTWMKMLIARPRPTFNEAYDAVSFSFPSAHASGSTAFYGFLIIFVMYHTENSAIKRIVIGLLVFLLLSIAFSRLILNVHYFSDMLGGIILGMFWLSFCLGLSKPLLQKNPPIEMH